MKSTSDDLITRGYIEDLDISSYGNLSIEKLYELFDSKNAFERTIAIRLLSKIIDINDSNFASALLDKLSIEKALYTKIEICSILENGNQDTCKLMIEYLGKIGDNQYKQVPAKVSKKISYPLPRDIIARTLGKMNDDNINILINVLKNEDLSKISEVLDSIGFMIFYNQELNTLLNFNIIKETLEKYINSELILWKGIICLSAFKLKENKEYLFNLKSGINNKTILLEIDRSLKFISKL